MVNQKKLGQVKSLNELLKEKTNFLLINFDRTTHQSLENLRRQLKKTKTHLKVIKNTLFEKAVNLSVSDKPLLAEIKKKFFPLKNSSALVTFDTDWSEGLKEIFNFFKKEKTISFKFALLDLSIFSPEEIERIAQLPTKNELLGKIIVTLKNPANRLVYSLKYNTNKLVYILKEKSKGGDK
jgi:large subunit ribosomal protein L10